ncbi:hypothetical protein F7725_025333 [Dissostichus mawsoni]|uniref:Uncharacterized protein n=1 Tax=Dissostichus mawsoni TaxID=36200 RepID=A0A7J5XBR9_DISMA|nr:hypothetical protein F7725_025333 [Dissostichus mawsoni]
MLHHQDQHLNSAYAGQGVSNNGSSSSLQNRKCDKDGNFNFLPGKDKDGSTGHGGGDENRNQVRPRSLGRLVVTLRTPPPLLGTTTTQASCPLAPRMPCWSPLEPLPEIECGDDGYGRVPLTERRKEEERRELIYRHEEKQREKREQQRRKSSSGFRGKEEDEDEAALEDGDEWGDSDSESEFSHRSGGSMSSSTWTLEAKGRSWEAGTASALGNRGPTTMKVTQTETVTETRSGDAEASPARSNLGNLLEEGAEEKEDDNCSSDSDGEIPELMDAVWTLRDRERFKAQEMEKHQVQLTMYRRLALIRWVRTLQSRIQEQQNRLQSSFDVILTQRKELLRMGAANAAPAAAPNKVGLYLLITRGWGVCVLRGVCVFCGVCDSRVRLSRQSPWAWLLPRALHHHLTSFHVHRYQPRCHPIISILSGSWWWGPPGSLSVCAPGPCRSYPAAVNRRRSGCAQEGQNPGAKHIERSPGPDPPIDYLAVGERAAGSGRCVCQARGSRGPMTMQRVRWSTVSPTFKPRRGLNGDTLSTKRQAARVVPASAPNSNSSAFSNSSFIWAASASISVVPICWTLFLLLFCFTTTTPGMFRSISGMADPQYSASSRDVSEFSPDKDPESSRPAFGLSTLRITFGAVYGLVAEPAVGAAHLLRPHRVPWFHCRGLGVRRARRFLFFAEEEPPGPGTGSGVDTSFFRGAGVFSLFSSGGATVFLGAIFLTVMERLAANAILLSGLTWILAGGELNRGDLLLCESFIGFNSAIMFLGVSSLILTVSWRYNRVCLDEFYTVE